MKKYILAIDQGTTGSTVLIFDKDGKIVSRGYKEFTQIYPQPGWVEHDPEEIWETTVAVIREALTSSQLNSQQIEAIGMTNQRETTVVWDKKSGKSIHPAIVWQCRRTQQICENLKNEGLTPFFQQRTGLVLDAYFSGTKIQWLLDNVPGARKKALDGDLLFGTIDTWLLWKLTGGKVHATDFTNASRTLIFNIHEQKWDVELLKILNIPGPLLPEVKNSAGLFGYTNFSQIFSAPVPILGIAGDQQAAMFGQCCWEPGMVKNTYGTGCFIMMNTGTNAIHSPNGLITTIAVTSDGKPCYALEGSVFIAGAAIQWLRDELKIIATASETEALAQSVANSNGVYLVPAFVGLGAPYWDMEARGLICGLTRGANRAHLVRAALESIAYQTQDVVRIMAGDANIPIRELRVDGGAAANNFLMQFQADILDIPVDRPEIIETTAMGAAFLAGLAADFWNSPAELLKARRRERKFTPAMDSQKREDFLVGWNKAIRLALNKNN
ncbi:glycerol kinase GlpK [candidate division KSB1 bacterium]|nr:glycerol kinase GlpK [candidate division KSB1 bacterium]